MPEFPNVYQALKLAKQLYDKPLEALTEGEAQKLRGIAARQAELEALILAAPEAAAVLAPDETIARNLAEIRGRYASDDEYRADLERIGLDDAGLRMAVERDLRVEAVLDRVAARSAMVSDTEVEIFWFMHRERWLRPETRVLRHILVTVNESLAENGREAAKARIGAIRDRLHKSPARFEEQALKHSECPTAMNGGLLGTVPRGQLYPELDAAGFALAAGEVSQVLESELGFHLLRCDAVHEARHRTLAEARDAIREHLEAQRRSACQKSWINGLRRSAQAA